MKKIIYTYSILMLCFAPAWATFDKTKSITKVIGTLSNPNIEIANKYGNVDVQVWDKDSVRFDVEITAYSNNLAKVNEMIKKISIRFTDNNSFIFAETMWENQSWLNDVPNDVKNMVGSDERITVNIMVMAPKNADLKIQNKFGDIILGNFNGNIQLVLSHGNIRADKLKKVKGIDLKYGKMRFDECVSANINLKFAEIKARKISKLTLNSTSSEFEIDKIDNLTINSRHDDISIENIGTITINSVFSDIDIETLESMLTGDIKFGRMRIDEALTPQITIGGNNTDVDLNFISGISFDYLVTLINGRSFYVDPTLNKTNGNTVNGDFMNYNGMFGKGTKSSHKATVSLKNSTVRFGLAD